MSDMLKVILEMLRRRESLATVTILAQEGSTPRTAGSKMLVGPQGLVAGSVGGGLLEGRSLEAAARALRSGRAEVLDFDLSGELAAGADMICGGRLRVFVEALGVRDLPFFEALDAALRSGGAVGTAIRLEKTGSTDRIHRLVLTSTGDQESPVGMALKKALPTDFSRLNAAVTVDLGDGGIWFVEPWLVPPRLVLAGGGHVAQATAGVAVLTGFAVTVLDDRSEFGSAARFPMAETVAVVPDFKQCFNNILMDAQTYVVILTRGHVHDATVLEQALLTRAGYIGMIGSVRKRDAIYESLRGKGVPDAELARVHCPVGLPIAAETPGEIAVSIVAECVAHRRKA